MVRGVHTTPTRISETSTSCSSSPARELSLKDTFTINHRNQAQMPVGGFHFNPELATNNTINLIYTTIDSGFDHFCVTGAKTEILGNIEACTRNRSGNPYITLILTADDISQSSVVDEVDKAHEALKSAPIDMLVIPRTTYIELKEINDAGLFNCNLVKNMGVSGIDATQLDALIKKGHAPACCVIDFNPLSNDAGKQKDLTELCKKLKIQMVSNNPFANGELLNDPTLLQIANTHCKTPVDVCLNWLRQKGVVALFSFNTVEDIFEHSEPYHFELTDEEMLAIDRLDR